MITHYIPSDKGIGRRERRISWRGYPYAVLSPSMPKVDPFLLAHVFYVYPSQDDAIRGSETGATGFFYGELSKINPLKIFLYAVTNSHVVFRNGMEEPILRINTVDGKFDIIKTSRNNWRPHPDGDDIAICPLALVKDRHKYGVFKRELVITNEFIKEFKIGAGDDVFMVGRFRVFAGKERNLPTVRFGNIAAMNNEPLYNPFTQLKQESFIVEMRSMSGYSGSPVVVYIPPASIRWDEPGKEQELNLTWEQRLLGINWGHIIYKEKAKDQYGQELLIEMDSAMAGIVPAWKLMDLIDSQEMIEMRKAIEEKFKKDADASGVQVTSHEEDKPEEKVFTKEDFEDAFRKIAHPLKKNDQAKKET